MMMAEKLSKKTIGDDNGEEKKNPDATHKKLNFFRIFFKKMFFFR